MQKLTRVLLILLLGFTVKITANPANRLTYLDQATGPYYVHKDFPKLITPQWVGEEGVEAVVILSIDDMRSTQHYENYLRPILNELKKIDGRAPVSIMTNSLNPEDPQLQNWLKEGLSLEPHTIDHPCPCLQGGDFARARSTYDRCIDLMAKIPNSHPVAYRMPCCDSRNTSSPRFWTEIFNRTTPDGNFLRIDSSVFNLFTPDDKEIPRDLVADEQGHSRFERYFPSPSFVNKIENYPYPYVIDDLCWQYPCVVPSDWEAQNIQGNNNPRTVEDLKSVLDITVVKKGIYTLVFHPHGWIRNDQVVELIRYSVTKHGKKVKFLNFKECQDRIEEHLMAGSPLRTSDGSDNGTRIVDLNNDGFMDVITGNAKTKRTRIWIPKSQSWKEATFPVSLIEKSSNKGASKHDPGVRFFTQGKSHSASFLINNEHTKGVWHFKNDRWEQDDSYLQGLTLEGMELKTSKNSTDLGVRLRDIDGDGDCELIVANPDQNAIFTRNRKNNSWKPLPYSLPDRNPIVTSKGHDAGLRFVDFNEDGIEDVIFSNEKRYALHVFSSIEKGWNRKAYSESRSVGNAIPMIVRGQESNGAWFSYKHMWVQNEDTSGLPDLVDRRSFDSLLGNLQPLPKSPKTSLQSIEVAPRFEVELVVSEPLVQDPVSMDWGSDGRLWVVEMADYPNGMDGKGKPGGRVRYLQDHDGDGEYDSSVIFCEDLRFPTDIMVWRKGVLVTASPDLWYLEDTDGDGSADRKEKWFTGFGQGNQQHQVNGLVWGLDNWVHVANGDSHGVITSSKSDDRVNISGRDLRIQPDTGKIEAMSGYTQHGRNRDDWGNWFGANNSFPLYQYILEDRYLKRNPHVRYASASHRVSTLDNSPLYPISRVMSHWSGYRPPPPGQPGRFTSGCGTIRFRDTSLGNDVYENMFTSAPVHNIVHRKQLRWDGLRLVQAKPEEEIQSEFLRSRDSWFRPTMLRTGPDGALWIADMYRLVIEHPTWIADDLEKIVDVRSGDDRGRIYRVKLRNKKTEEMPQFHKLDSRELIDLLKHSNGWIRDRAHRELLWRGQKKTASLLVETFIESANPLQRLHTLCVLDGLKALPEDIHIIALNDPHPHIRRHAVRMAERTPSSTRDSQVIEALIRQTEAEDHPQVLLQLANSIGELNSIALSEALGSLLARHHRDPYMVSAGLSSSSRTPESVLNGLLSSKNEAAKRSNMVLALIQTALGNGDQKQIRSCITSLLNAEKSVQEWQLTVLTQIETHLRARNLSLEKLATNSQVQAQLDRLRKQSRELLRKKQTSNASKRIFLNLLQVQEGTLEEDISLVLHFACESPDANLKREAFNTLNRFPLKAVSKSILENWKKHPASSKAQLLSYLLRNGDGTFSLLKAIEKKQVSAGEIQATHRQFLLKHPNGEISNLASRFFRKNTHPKKQNLIDSYLTSTTRKPDLNQGLSLFSKHCASCHKVGAVGHEVGPNLMGLVTKTPEYFTTHILDPNRAIEDKYKNYTVITKAGEIHSGILKEETSTSITLQGLNNSQAQLLKKDLIPETFKRSPDSMMPNGLEEFITPDGMIDVIAYILENQIPPKSFAGNQPQVVKESAGKAFRLRASHAEIYGNTLIFEGRYKNLGFWGSENDQAIWTLDHSAKPSTFEVYLDWAAAQNIANNPFILQAGDQVLQGRVGSTGTWDNYRQIKLGEINLPTGTTRLTFQAKGQPRGFLIDLREICLVRTGHPPPPPFKQAKN